MNHPVSLPAQVLKAYEKVPDCYLILSPELVILTASDAYLEATFAQREAIVGKCLFDVFPRTSSASEERVLDALFASLQQVLKTKKPHHLSRHRYDLVHPKEGKVERYRRISNTPVEEGRTVLYLIHKVEDITRQVTAEQRLAGNEALLRSTEAAADIGSYEVDLKTNKFHFSDGLYRLFGEEPGNFEPSLEWIDSRSHPDDRLPVRKALKEAAASNKPYCYTRRVYRKDGELRLLETHGKVMADAKGHAIKFIGVVQDVTKRKKAEKEILSLKDEIAQTATDKYYSLFNSIDEGLSVLELIYDDGGKPVDLRLLEVNPAYERITGLKNVSGKLGSEIVPSEQYWLDAYDSVLKTGESLRFENYHAGTKQWYRTHTSRIGGPGSRMVANVFEDITDRKQQEQQQEYLLKLSDVLRPLMKPVEIQAVAARILGERLHTDRAYYVDINEPASELIVAHDWHRPDAPSHARRYPLGDWPMPWLIDGKTWVVCDMNTDSAMPADQRELYLGNDIGAAVVVPLIKQGKLVATFVINQRDPRSWTQAEVSLVEETAERTWAAVERAKAEEALLKREEQLRLITNAMPALIAYIDTGFRYRFANKYYENWFGYSPEEVIGKHMREFLGDTAFERLRPHVEAALAGQRHSFEEEVTFKYGGTRYVHSEFVPEFRSDGTVAGYHALVTDITASKQAAEALKKSEEQFRQAIQAAPIPIIMHAEDGEVLQISRTWTALTGYRQEEVPTFDHWLTQAYGEGADVVRGHMQQLFKGNKVSLNIDFPVRTRVQGLRYWSFSASSPGTLADGRRYIVGMAVDITERKLSEEKLRNFNKTLEQQVAERTQDLRQSRDILQSLFDTTLLSLSILKAVRDEKGTIIDFMILIINKELERVTGRTDLVGKLYLQEFPGIKQAGLFDLMLRVMETGEPEQVEYYYPHENFNKWYSAMFVKMDDGVVASNLDITDRKLAEAELTRNFAILNQAEEVARMGSWEYDIASGEMSWGAGMYRLFGLPAGSPVKPETYLRYVIAEDKPLAQRLVEKLREKHEDIEETLRLRVGDQTLTCRMKAVVLRDELGAPTKILGTDLDISEVKRLEEENLQMRLNQQKELLLAILEAQEEERRRISESLHNGVGQILYATKLNLDQVAQKVPKELIQQTENLLKEAIAETRRVSHELVPIILNDFGLEKAMESLCQQYDQSLFQVNCEVDLEERLASYLEIALYRISQELLNNVVKHAQATQADILLVQEDGEIILKVRDNGQGMKQESGKKKGIGLRSIADRVKLLNGTFLITESKTGRGTLATVRIPVTEM
ncbi:PAS domain S-box protein [Pontibacter sp. SGAir0037]|uniref:PAS domain S-box protein n=1 Tax=Pontibacter sp. SGAir0037 TaxID=2571030 RepID=UPI0010CD1C63|nr:PAS domain S-box protein [Pontibacter sp. SGAir0037]QCR22381.1 hypothetical protein C1N53_08550 [Pontibacter sp. SGAir0037]